MKIKIGKLLEMKKSLEKLISLDDIPIKTSFKIAKSIKNFNDEYTAFEDSKTKLFKKYGEENKEGNLEVKKENIEKFKKEIEDLMEIKINIKVPKVTLKELGDIKISPGDIANLDILIVE